MELEKVKELVELMKANDLNELEIVDGPVRIMLKRGAQGNIATQMVTLPQMVQGGGLPGGGGSGQQDSGGSSGSEPSVDAGKDDNLVEIKAPLVGTFYATPSPNADPFVEAGSRVDPDTVVCIVEAMKVMNEIKSEVKGTIKKVLVDNGQAVEYGQPLFLVEPE